LLFKILNSGKKVKNPRQNPTLQIVPILKIHYIIYSDIFIYNGTTTYSDFENESVDLNNLGLFINFNKSTEILYECRIKYNFYNYSFEGILNFNTVNYTFHSLNDSTKKMHMPIFNPPNIRIQKHFPFLTFSRDEPSIMYYESSKDYVYPTWNNYQIEVPPQQGVYLYGIYPKHPETLDPLGSFEYEYESDFLVSGGFPYDSLPLFLELSNPEISTLSISASNCYLRRTNLPFRNTPFEGIYIGSDHYIFLIFVSIGIAGICLFIFIIKKLRKLKYQKKIN